MHFCIVYHEISHKWFEFVGKSSHKWDIHDTLGDDHCIDFLPHAPLNWLKISNLTFPNHFLADDDDMTDLAEAIMEDCDGEVGD